MAYARCCIPLVKFVKPVIRLLFAHFICRMQGTGQLKHIQNMIMGQKNEVFTAEEQEKWNNKIKKEHKIKKEAQM